MKPAVALLSLLLAACGSTPATPTTTAANEPVADEPDPAETNVETNVETEPGPTETVEAEAAPSDVTGLSGDWHEDQSQRAGDLLVFVPTVQDLGPSRYRQSWRFEPDGTAHISVLAPSDAHFEVEGTWRREGVQFTLHYSALSEVRVERYEILGRSDTELRVRRIRTPGPGRAH
jgi:hypothetical protein